MPNTSLSHSSSVIALALTIAIAPVMYLEGRKQEAYLDIVGVATICYGSTTGVKLGQTKTDAECSELLRGELGHVVKQVDALVSAPLPATRLAALSSFAYNVGIGRFRKSTLLKRLNAGEGASACEELSRWVYAAGKPVDGLITRRFIERALCEWSASDDAIRQASTWVDQVISVKLSTTRHAALTAYAFNLGLADFRRSPVVRRLNAGEGAHACRSIPQWPSVHDAGERDRRLTLMHMCEVEL